MMKYNDFRIEFINSASREDRDEIFAEIYYKDDFIAEIFQKESDENFKISFSTDRSVDNIEFSFKDFLKLCEMAKDRLSDSAR